MTQTKPIWIIDDDRSIRWVFEKTLARENLDYKSFGSADEALAELAHSQPQVVVTDIRMPGGSGLDLLQTIKERHPALPVIIMTAYSDLDSAVAAFQGGAFEYLPKPFDIDHAVELIRRALDESMRGTEAAAAEEAAPEMLGQAPAMQEVFRAIGRLANSQATVLITGESGSGKELVARALHRHSPRRDKPFIALNTAAIPKDLLESELFGHERGAFTGAAAARDGAFALADGGTLFLDEIGELPLPLQAQLLRAIQEHKYKRVGSNTWQHAVFRLVCATNRDLEDEVAKGRFRADLFYRIAGWRCKTPPLRERGDDILPLVRHFLTQLAPRDWPFELDAAVREYLLTRAYPGNVRDLRQCVTRIWHRHTGPGPITIGDVPPEERQLATLQRAWPDCGFENAIRRALDLGMGLGRIGQAAGDLAIQLVLEQEGDNNQRAAARLGVTDRALQIRRKAWANL